MGHVNRWRMLRKLRRMRRTLDRLANLQLDTWWLGQDSENPTERDVAQMMRTVKTDGMRGLVQKAIDRLHLDASTESWPHVTVRFDPATYRDPDSGARFVVATISTMAHPTAPNVQDQLVSSRREALPIDGLPERTSTIANAVNAPAPETDGGRR